jgi:opacity protein-like surface antigen
MSRPPVGLVIGAACALAVRAAPAQRVMIGPQFVLANYREVSSGLQFSGIGFGGAAVAHWRRFGAEAVVTRVTFKPSGGAGTLQSFDAIEIDGWLSYNVASYASVEAGLTYRDPSPDFGAQRVGAVRVGARAASEIGRGATVSFRADYLAAPQFSGGGHASVSLDLGLGLDVRLAGRLHATAAYAFQHFDRKTNPGGTAPDTPAPIQQSLARVGLGVGF